MSSEGLPVDGVVSVGVELGPRSTEQAADAAKSSLSADSAAQSADAAFKFSRQAKDAVSGADAAADRAEAAANNAQNIADANTYYITPEDPDGTIAGIAGTPNGESFRVPQGDGALASFVYYRNVEGAALLVATAPSAKQVELTKIALQRSQVVMQLLSVAVGQISDADALQNDDIAKLKNSLQNMYLSLTVLSQGLASLAEETNATKINATLQNLYLAFQNAQNVLLQTVNVDYLEEVQLQSLFALHCLSSALTNEASGGSGEAVEVFSQQFAMPRPGSIVRIDLTQSAGLPTAKDDVRPGSISITVDGTVFKAQATYEVQGATSSLYPKKNLTFGLFSDTERKNEVTLKIGDVLPHQEWIFKANWIDCTQVRDMLSYDLWDQVMDTRKGWPKRDVDYSYVGKVGKAGFDNGATAHPRRYPAVMYNNGEFYGIGTIGLGKKRQNYNISKNKPTEIWVGLDDGVDLTRLTPTTPGISVKAPSTITPATTQVFSDFSAFMLTSNTEGLVDFKANADKFLNKANIIDFYLFIQVLLAVDCVQKNTILTCRDGKQWFFNPYDLDSVYGLHWAGTSIEYAPTVNIYTDYAYSVNAPFYNGIYSIWGADIDARYAQLRADNVYTVDNIYQIAVSHQQKYTAEMVSAELKAWPTQPSWTLTSLDQIMNWTKARFQFLDTLYHYSA